MKDRDVREEPCIWEGKDSELRRASSLEILERVIKCIPPSCLQKECECVNTLILSQ